MSSAIRLSSTTPLATRCAASSNSARHGLERNFPLRVSWLGPDLDLMFLFLFQFRIGNAWGIYIPEILWLSYSLGYEAEQAKYKSAVQFYIVCCNHLILLGYLDSSNVQHNLRVDFLLHQPSSIAGLPRIGNSCRLSISCTLSSPRKPYSSSKSLHKPRQSSRAQRKVSGRYGRPDEQARALGGRGRVPDARQGKSVGTEPLMLFFPYC